MLDLENCERAVGPPRPVAAVVGRRQRRVECGRPGEQPPRRPRRATDRHDVLGGEQVEPGRGGTLIAHRGRARPCRGLAERQRDPQRRGRRSARDPAASEQVQTPSRPAHLARRRCTAGDPGERGLGDHRVRRAIAARRRRPPGPRARAPRACGPRRRIGTSTASRRAPRASIGSSLRRGAPPSARRVVVVELGDPLRGQATDRRRRRRRAHRVQRPGIAAVALLDHAGLDEVLDEAHEHQRVAGGLAVQHLAELRRGGRELAGRASRRSTRSSRRPATARARSPRPPAGRAARRTRRARLPSPRSARGTASRWSGSPRSGCATRDRRARSRAAPARTAPRRRAPRRSSETHAAAARAPRAEAARRAPAAARTRRPAPAATSTTTWPIWPIRARELAAQREQQIVVEQQQVVGERTQRVAEPRQRPLVGRAPAAERQRARRRVAHQRPHQLGAARALATRQKDKRRRAGRRPRERLLERLPARRRGRTTAAETAGGAGPTGRARTAAIRPVGDRASRGSAPDRSPARAPTGSARRAASPAAS